MTEVDIIRQIPILVPTNDQRKHIEKLCKKVIDLIKKDKNPSKQIDRLNNAVYDIYGISKRDRDEVSTWMKRRYYLRDF